MSSDYKLNGTRELMLEEQYAAALTDWQESGEAEVWEGVVGDELNDETSQLNKRVDQ